LKSYNKITKFHSYSLTTYSTSIWETLVLEPLAIKKLKRLKSALANSTKALYLTLLKYSMTKRLNLLLLRCNLPSEEDRPARI
jgi:hypothetical protein